MNCVFKYFSYLDYDNQFDTAAVMIEEGTYSQKEIDKQAKALEKAKGNLIDISKEITLLKKVNKGSYSSAVKVAFDSLIREVLSCQVYVNGRSNDLKYASIYRNHSIESTFNCKRKAIAKKYKNLSEYI